MRHQTSDIRHTASQACAQPHGHAWLRRLLLLGLVASTAPAPATAGHTTKAASLMNTSQQAPPPAPQPRSGVVRVRSNDTIFRVGPGTDYDRRTPLAAGVPLRVLGSQGSWLEVSLGGGDVGWVEERGVEWLKDAACPPGLVRNVIIRSVGRETYVDVQTSRKVAFDLLEQSSPTTLKVRLHDSTLSMHELAQFTTATLVHDSQLTQLRPGTAELTLHLDQRALWGYRASWVSNPNLESDPAGHDWRHVAPETLRLVLRKAPATSALKDLCVVIDAGHGGDDPGAVGVAGLQEKDANLAVAVALGKLLEQQGARVHMTRSIDRSVASEHDDELAARVRSAAEGGGDLFISIHHNARARIDDARVARGSYVYYYHPQSADLARHLSPPLAQAAGEPSSAYIWRSFHVTRQTWMPAVLAEVCFISNPQTEQGMRDPGYAARIAAGLAKGLRSFLDERLPPPPATSGLGAPGAASHPTSPVTP